MIARKHPLSCAVRYVCPPPAPENALFPASPSHGKRSKITRPGRIEPTELTTSARGLRSPNPGFSSKRLSAYLNEMTESKQNRLEWLPEWQKKIIRKYPVLYLETSPAHSKDSGKLPDDHCNLRYGFECEAGWEELIDELSATGEALVKALRAFNFQDDARVSGLIVKEKFGRLCWQGQDNLLPPFHSLWWGYTRHPRSS